MEMEMEMVQFSSSDTFQSAISPVSGSPCSSIKERGRNKAFVDPFSLCFSSPFSYSFEWFSTSTFQLTLKDRNWKDHLLLSSILQKMNGSCNDAFMRCSIKRGPMCGVEHWKEIKEESELFFHVDCHRSSFQKVVLVINLDLLLGLHTSGKSAINAVTDNGDPVFSRVMDTKDFKDTLNPGADTHQ